jgi:hypothetical protein
MARAPLYRFPDEPPRTDPGDDIRRLVELTRAGGPSLVRRWVAALLRLDAGARESLVAEAERRAGDGPVGLTVVHPPRSYDGYMEQVERSYEIKPASDGAASRRRSRGA